ncbi:hypothetical protein EC951288_2771A, partial [Escherichia coli 95.1288]
MNIPLF